MTPRVGRFQLRVSIHQVLGAWTGYREGGRELPGGRERPEEPRWPGRSCRGPTAGCSEPSGWEAGFPLRISAETVSWNQTTGGKRAE